MKLYNIEVRAKDSKEWVKVEEIFLDKDYNIYTTITIHNFQAKKFNQYEIENAFNLVKYDFKSKHYYHRIVDAKTLEVVKL